MTPLGAQGPYPLSASSEWQLKLPKNAYRFFGSIFFGPTTAGNLKKAKPCPLAGEDGRRRPAETLGRPNPLAAL